MDEEVVGLFLAHHSAHPEREPYEALRAEAEALGRRTGADPRRLLFDRLEQQYGVDPQRWWAARSTTALSHKLAAELGSAEAGAGFGAAAGRVGRRHEPLLADATAAGRRGARLFCALPRFCAALLFVLRRATCLAAAGRNAWVRGPLTALENRLRLEAGA